MAKKKDKKKDDVDAKRRAGFQFRAGILQQALDRFNENRQEFIKMDNLGHQNEMGYLQKLRDLDLVHGKTQMANRSTAASRGIGRSSAYAKMANDEATGFNRQLGDLNIGRQSFNNADLVQRNAINTGYRDYLRQLALQQTQFDAENGLPGKKIPFYQFQTGKPKLNYVTPNNNSFLQQMRKKYGF